MTSRAIELELYRQILVSIAEEMGAVLRGTSFSANIKERRDYSCAIYDRDGLTIAMGDHMPVHLGAMPLSVAEALRSFRLEPGDIAILNDPFRGGTHLPDITAVSGVFLPGASRPEFYVANRAHHADVGGMSPGSMPLASEIYQEGLRIPPVRIQRRGRMEREWLDLILSNVRTPIEREGDLMAQFMSLQRGERRLMGLVSRFGQSRGRRLAAALMDYSERTMAAEISCLPEGEYRFHDTLDGGIPICVSIRIAGGRATVDFTGSAPQQEAPVNANYAIALSATMYAFRCLIREQTPYTSGLLRRLEVIAPEGTVVNARPPAAMAAGNVETSQRLVDVLLGALAQAAPDRIPAASSGTMSNFSFGGRDANGQPFAYYETIAGGMGAGPRSPGRAGTHTHMTNSWNTPVEAMEHQYPVRIRRYTLRPSSGGGGLFPGGDGIVREFEFLVAAECTLLADRRQSQPYGLAGGQAAACGRAFLNGKRLPGRARFAVQPGDRVRIETPGGGGWGKP